MEVAAARTPMQLSTPCVCLYKAHTTLGVLHCCIGLVAQLHPATAAVPLQADLSENKAKKMHPELRKFQLEKQAR
jgi:hypothetical protein